MKPQSGIPVRLASEDGPVLFRAPRLKAAFVGHRRDGFFEYADGLKVTAIQRRLEWRDDDHWVASRAMSDAEKQVFLREVEEDNRFVTGELRRYAGRE